MSLFDWHKDLEGNIVCNYENWSFFVLTKHLAFWIDTYNCEIEMPAPFWFEDLKEVDSFNLVESCREVLNVTQDKSIYKNTMGPEVLEFLYEHNIQRS